MKLADLQQLHARCEPDEALAPGDARYVDIDHFGGGGESPRRHAWVEHIANKFELRPDRPRVVLLTGLPGSGKSTELHQVAKRLARVEGPRLFPIEIDAEACVDLDGSIDVPDFALTMLAEIERAVLGKEGRDESNVGQESPMGRLWNWLKNTNVELPNLELGSGPLRLPIQLKTQPSLRDRVRQAVLPRLAPFLAEVRGQIDLLQERIRRYEVSGSPQKYSGIFVVFDSLEKLRGISQNHHDVLRSAEHVFQRQADLLNFGVHAVYTVPLAIAQRVSHVLMMPVIKHRNQDGSRFDPGWQALRALVDRRLDPREQRELFGDEFDSRVEQLIDRSGGYPRELVALLQATIEERDFPLAEVAFRRVLADRADEYSRKVPAEAIELLRTVRRSRGPFLIPDEHRDIAEALLTRSLVFYYQNEREWAAVNPAIEHLLGEP